MYAIKVILSDNTETWMKNFSEYVGQSTDSTMKFETIDEAEIWAQGVELKKYRIEKYEV